MELFRENDLKWLKEKGDDAWNWEEIIKGVPGKVAELGDGPVIGVFTKQLNKWLSPQIPDSAKEELHDVFDSVMEGNYNEALAGLADVAVAVMDNFEISEKIKPWINLALELYKGIIAQFDE